MARRVEDIIKELKYLKQELKNLEDIGKPSESRQQETVCESNEKVQRK